MKSYGKTAPCCKKSYFPVCASPKTWWGDTLHAQYSIEPGRERTAPGGVQLSNLEGYVQEYFFWWFCCAVAIYIAQSRVQGATSAVRRLFVLRGVQPCIPITAHGIYI